MRDGMTKNSCAIIQKECDRTQLLEPVRAHQQLKPRVEGYSKRYLKIAGRWRDHERWALLAEDFQAIPFSRRAPHSTVSNPRIVASHHHLSQRGVRRYSESLEGGSRNNDEN